MESKPEIFFSYAWSDDTETGTSREKIVNDLYESLIADGFNVIRDKNDLRYKGLISGLVGRIGKGKFIVVAISDKYLKSTYCMSELLEIYRRSNSDIDELLKKIFPIILADAKIYNPEDRVDYLKYWEDKKEELTEELKGIELAHAATFANELSIYNEITSVMPILSRLLKDINTLNPQKLSANNFAEIKNAIIKTASALPTSGGTETINKPITFRWRRPAIVAAIVIAILAIFLHFGHVSTTRIRMELSVSELTFRLPQQQVVTNIMRLSSIGASGLDNVQLPTLRTQAAPGSVSSSSAVLLAVDTTRGRAGSLTVDALALPAGIRIGIRHTDVTGEYRFSLQEKALNLPVQVNGFVQMALPPHPREDLNFTSPGLINLQSGKDGVDLDLNFLLRSNRIFPGVIDVDSISFTRIDENFDDETSIVRTVSTILNGTLYYESSGGKKQLLSNGEQIQFKKSEGKITSVELLDDRIAVTFVGSVSGMTTGDGNNRTSLMPSYLEWLKSQVGLALLLVAVLLTFVLIFGVSRLRRTSI